MKTVKQIKIKKTLVAMPKGCKYIEVTHIGEIGIKTIKDIKNGATFNHIFVDELCNLKENQ